MYRIGIDLGGTNIAAGIVNENYEILVQDSTPTKAGRPGEEIVADMAALCRKLCAKAGITEAEVESLGIASPGVVDDNKGTVVAAYNLGFFHFPILPLLKEQLSIPTMHIANDANAAAWGEAVAGAGKGSSSSIMVTLGTGVGGGIILNNKLLTGFNEGAGELGHMVIRANGRPCTCGRIGCWEAYSSATGLIKMTKEKLEECEREGRKTLMSEIVAERGKVTGRTAFDAKRRGDAAADEVVEEYVSYLACGITNLVNIFQPEVISIGGGISNEGQYLLDLITPIVRKESFGSGRLLPTELRIAQLRNNAGIIGAALLGVGAEA